MSTLLFSLMAPALAGQSHAASGYTGSYDLTCEEASLSLHLDLAWSVAGSTGTAGDAINVDLDCDGIDETEWQTLHDDVQDACDAAWPVEEDCDALGTAAADAVAAFNDGTLEFVPESVDFTVYGTGNFWYRLFGVYPLRGTHHFPSGSSSSWWYLLNNNDGGSLGDFATFAMVLNGSASGSNWACADLSLGAISGDIDPNADYDLAAAFGVDRSAVCGAGDGVDAVVAVLGLTFDGDVSGVRQ